MNSHATWVRIALCTNIPLREGRAVRLGEREIAIFNLGDRFLAIDNRCPHEGGPLADGILCGSSVVCPLHSWKIGLKDGTVERPADNQACVETFATRVENDTILLKIPECSRPEVSDTFASSDNSSAGSECQELPARV